jgi:type II secretion system protein C
MKRMRPLAKALREWLPQAPHWTALLLGVLMVADAAHIVLRVSAAAGPTPEARRGGPRSGSSQLARLDSQQIAGAHLFGVDPAAARSGTAGPPETASHLALSGVIATSDPGNGYAILGEQGQPTRLYRAGAALANAGSATLYQVFADHVVLDLGGRWETLSLPRQHLGISGTSPVARLELPTARVSTGTDAIPTPISAREEAPSAAEGWFSNLYAERYTADGRSGLRLHPPKVFQRRYGLRDGDTLTAVNGVPVGDEDAVDSVLRAGGKTVALTLTRDGIEETMRFPVER